MKKITNTIIRSTALMIILLPLFFVCFVVFDNANTWIITVFPDYGDLEDWWYEFTVYGYVNYLLATVLLSGVLSLLLEVMAGTACNLPALILEILLGEGVIGFAYCGYWDYLTKVCFDCGASVGLDICFAEAFGSTDGAYRFLLTATAVFFAIGMTVRSNGCFFADPVKKTAITHVASNDQFYLPMICVYIPLINLGTGAYYWGLNRIPVAEILAAVLGVALLWHLVIVVAQFCCTARYYAGVIGTHNGERCLVVVQELQEFGKSVLYNDFIMNRKVMHVLNKANIGLIPQELYDRSVDVCAVVDVYDERLFAHSADRRGAMIDKLQQLCGTFNFAYCTTPSKLGVLCSAYECCISDPEALAKKMAELSKLRHYREEQLRLLGSLQFGTLTKSNVILDEIAGFKHRFDKYIGVFLDFDYSIKWLEAISYLYTLTACLDQNIGVSARLLEEISMGDFGKWIKVRNKFASGSPVYAAMANVQDDQHVFRVCEYLWKMVTSQEYAFEQYSLHELLNASKKLRDYTRGHGVFTFEITPEINLAMLEILVFLINQLLKNPLLDGELDHIAQLGWTVDYGEDPYFLYSYDKENQELHFDSFKNGNSITLPTDVWKERL